MIARRTSIDPWRAALRGLAGAAAIVVGLAPAPAGARRLAPAGVDDPSAEDTRARAAAAVARGRAAFDAGDFAAAIVAFEEALALRPAAKLHYNLGVCHQRLMQDAAAAGDAATEAAEASAAIVSLNRYLAARPDAEDRAEVEALVTSLGGVPVAPPVGAKGGAGASGSAGAGASEPAPAGDDPTPPASDPTGATGEPPDAPSAPGGPPAPLLPRGAFGAFLSLAATPQLTDNAAIEGAGLVALGLRGDARLGRRRRASVGGELELGSGGATDMTRLGLATQGLAAVAGLHLPVGGGHRIELPFALGAGVSREAIRTRGELERPICASGSGTLIGKRVGGRVSGRLGIAVLVGARRHHGLGLLLGAVLTAYGRGPLAEGCSEAVFAGLGIPRVRVAVGLDLAYTFRF